MICSSSSIGGYMDKIWHAGQATRTLGCTGVLVDLKRVGEHATCGPLRRCGVSVEDDRWHISNKGRLTALGKAE
jgi:hypothetical protein